jgi:hypothetical protein
MFGRNDPVLCSPDDQERHLELGEAIAEEDLLLPAAEHLIGHRPQSGVDAVDALVLEDVVYELARDLAAVGEQ